MFKSLQIKKCLLLLALLAGVGTNAWADVVTITPSDGKAVESSDYSITKEPITVAVTTSTLTADQMRVFKNQSITISSTTATISKIEFTCTAEGTNKYGPGCLSGTGYEASTGKTGVWTGSSPSVTLKASTNQCRITEIVVTYSTSGGDTPAKVATPVINGDEVFINSTEVSITCGTEGATILYSLDDGTNWTNYSAPFAITETKTVKAKATKTGMDDSDVASKLFNMKMVLTVVRALGAIDLLEDNGTMTDEFVQGKISQIDSYNSSYKSITYWISDDGTTTNQLEVYSGKGLNGADFAAITDLKVGDEVIVFGTLKKYVDKNDNTIPEFTANSKIVKYTPSETPVPALTVSKTSLTGFTYVQGEGPSEEQSFEVTGTNLTGDVTLDLGEPSYYEISVSEGTGFATKLVLNKVEANPKTIYVRLKAGYEVSASYEGTITITSEGAAEKEVSLNGSVTAPAVPEDPNFTWNLTTNSYIDASETQVSWLSFFASMIADKDESGTKANNYLGGDANNRTSSRFYTGSKLTITPSKGYTITSVEFLATTTSYATALKQSSWTNANASVDGKTVTVTPKDGSAVFYAKIGGTTGVETVKYYISKDITIGTEGYTTYVAPANVKFPSGLTAYIVTNVGENSVTLTEVAAVPEDAAVILKGTGTFAVEVVGIDECDAVVENKLLPSFGTATTTDKQIVYALAKDNNDVVGFYKVKKDVCVPAGKCYIQVDASSSARNFLSFGEETTGIEAVKAITNDRFYDLQGRRVAQPTKGLYIVNGKKVIIK
ncbi:MAG: chitobiase/beta-hexosaminidase C-terminal domain-containing protein [Prevotella sp.]|nr:chitobiase/beta-hexosaminidase C-terminal domain-containing protein [Prevotella sp.]